MDSLKTHLRDCHGNAAELITIEQRLRMCVDHLIGSRQEADRKDDRGDTRLPEAVIETLAFVNGQQQSTLVNISSLIAQIEEAIGIHSEQLATRSVGIRDDPAVMYRRKP